MLRATPGGGGAEQAKWTREHEDLAATQAFALLCAYPTRSFEDEANSEAFRRICEQHITVIPGEGVLRLEDRGILGGHANAL